MSRFCDTDKYFNIYEWCDNKLSLKELQSFIFQNFDDNLDVKPDIYILWKVLIT